MGKIEFDVTPRLFLDIDGVMNTPATRHAWSTGGWLLTPRAVLTMLPPGPVALLNRITRETGAGIVLSTSWRRPEIMPLGVRAMLRHAGVTGEIVGETPVLPPSPLGSPCRGHEIAHYLRDHGISPHEYAILDDVPEAAYAPVGFPTTQAARFVWCDPDHGLTDAEAAKVIELLRGG